AHLADAVGALTRRRGAVEQSQPLAGPPDTEWRRPQTLPCSAHTLSDGGPASGLEPRRFVAQEGRSAFFPALMFHPGGFIRVKDKEELAME
ncbi:MAG: hypothetical protein P1P84_24755, partial [Deferrisomatales bacterium]|nr:hypothetical protein [Deferrisomatales bacterium]